jgi:hypothetical protein
MVLWPDYWAPSVAPDLFRIAPEATPPSGTVESGQMVIHKRRCWRALLLTLFLNCQGSLYYNLLTNYMGVGDKETFPIAMRMLQLVRARARVRLQTAMHFLRIVPSAHITHRFFARIGPACAAVPRGWG